MNNKHQELTDFRPTLNDNEVRLGHDENVALDLLCKVFNDEIKLDKTPPNKV